MRYRATYEFEAPDDDAAREIFSLVCDRRPGLAPVELRAFYQPDPYWMPVSSECSALDVAG